MEVSWKLQGSGIEVGMRMRSPRLACRSPHMAHTFRELVLAEFE